jgi:predicted metal-dependent hydrolase
MIQKLGHRINSLPAGRASRYNNALPALRDGWRFVHKIRKIVTLDFF